MKFSGTKLSGVENQFGRVRVGIKCDGKERRLGSFTTNTVVELQEEVSPRWGTGDALRTTRL